MENIAKYSITRETERDVWKWRVVMGHPETLRTDEEPPPIMPT